LNNLVAGIGTGYSKKESHQQAAQRALNKIKSDKNFVREVMNLNKKEETQESKEIIDSESLI
jgi:ribonuclease-3